MRFHTHGNDSSDNEDNSITPSAKTDNNTTNFIHIRKFEFNTIDDTAGTLVIKIPESLQGAYSFYTWPCAPILAYFLWERQQALVGKRILELGCGTALPGILAAKCGAQVILSDNSILPRSLAHIHKSCQANNLRAGVDIEIIGLSWGLLNSIFSLPPLDFIIAADCFYEPSIFEDIIVTVSFLLERNPNAKFIFTYQERSTDWSIEALLKKWQLNAEPINIDEVGKKSNIDLLELMGGHTIHLLEVTKKINFQAQQNVEHRT